MDTDELDAANADTVASYEVAAASLAPEWDERLDALTTQLRTPRFRRLFECCDEWTPSGCYTPGVLGRAA
jgi:hypothetical protein